VVAQVRDSGGAEVVNIVVLAIGSSRYDDSGDGDD